MLPTTRAFRFIAYGRAFAVDIQNDRVLLFGVTPDGWSRATEFAAIPATNADIEAAGGPVKFVDAIIAAVNQFLRLIGAKPKPEDLPAPREGSLQDAVLADLNANVRPWEMMDGTFELQRKQAP